MLKDRHFRFSVASKHVGFEVCNLRRIVTEYFDVYFHLWRDGGLIGLMNGSNGKKRMLPLGSKFLIARSSKPILKGSLLLLS
jgi:hypothetical protein